MFNVAIIRLKDLFIFFILSCIFLVIFFFVCRKDSILKQNVSANINKYAKDSLNIELSAIRKGNTIKFNNNSQVIEENEQNKDNEEKIAKQVEELKENSLINTIIGLELGFINVRKNNTEYNNKKYIKVGQNSKSEEFNELSNDSETEVSSEEASSEEISSDKSAEKSETLINGELLEKNETLNNSELTENDNKQNNGNNVANNESQTDIDNKEGDITTQIITKNPISDSYTKKYNGVKIKNETSFDLAEKDLNSENFTIDKNNIIIFHTHTCESYTSSIKYSYTPTGNYRTTDLKYSVARVGDELTKCLNKYNINVIHDKTYHDYPSYNGSYSRSLATVSKILKNKKADIIIDLHRDAIGSYSGYAPTVKIGEDECAQIMFVIGTNGGKLNHPNWKNNLKFAIKVQEIANKKYPGLFKPIILRNSRYNQHLGKAACIIEVGSTGNKLEQCLNSMKYLATIIKEL